MARMRLDRALANCGVGSRAEVRVLINRGRVRVGDDIVRDAGTNCDPTLVTLDGEPLDHPSGVLIGLHKPVGYSSSHDTREAPLVDELLPSEWAGRTPRPEWAGRLDRDTSGLIIISDDHQLLHRLTSPRHHVDKMYVATVDHLPADDAVQRFATGLVLEGEENRPCLPAVLSILAPALYPALDGSGGHVSVTLREGRYHQVRRMLAAVGVHVVALHRVSFGPWTLDGLALAEGDWCDVTLPDS